MSAINIPHDKERIIATLSEWADALPDRDKPLVHDASGQRYSASRIIDEVKMETDYGRQYVQSMMELALRSLLKKTRI